MKRKILFAALSVLLAVGIGVRLYLVNVDAERLKISTYPKGETVSIGKNFFDKSDENMDGYTIKVLDSWVEPVKDFLIANNEREDLINADYLLMVKVELVNEYNQLGEEAGIDLNWYSLNGINYLMTIDPVAYKIANPSMDFMKFSLKPNKPPFELVLPFAVYETNMSVEHLKRHRPKLQICAYPEMKLLDIEFTWGGR